MHTDSKCLRYQSDLKREDGYFTKPKYKKFPTYLIDLNKDFLSDDEYRYCKKFKTDKIFVAELSGDHGS